ncbi:hypothetical protein [Clostridium akagii]|uniref:hypothetical protein n=1 Tax=Clostridium akagii TaxID=91623 RepID=UPI00047DF610|nr:hypothetical protein [Clostridium akagii]
MEINFTVSKEDFLDFKMRNITETKQYKHLINIITITMFLLSILTIILSKNKYNLLTIFIIWIIILLFRKKYILHEFRKKIKNIYSTEKYTDFFEPTKIIINEYGLKSITDLAEKNYKWVSIKDLYLIDSFLWIRTSTKNDIFIPMRSFKSFEVEKLFLNSIVKNTGLQLKKTYPIDFN